MNTHQSTSTQFRSFIKGETEGYAYFYYLHWTYILSYIESLVKRADMAEDICQECFVVLWHRRKQIRNENHLRYFLVKVATRLSLRQLKSQENTRAAEARWTHHQNPDTEESPDKAVIGQIDELVQGIEQLPLQRRMTILYKYFRGWSVKKIAEFFGVAEQTTRNNENQGKQQLRKIVNPPSAATSRINIPSNS